MDTENNYQLSVQENQSDPTLQSEYSEFYDFIGHRGKEWLALIKTIVNICIKSETILAVLFDNQELFGNEEHSKYVVYEKELFLVLTTVSPECANLFVSKLDCPHYIKSDLIDSIRNKDYNRFYSVVHQEKCDLTSIERPCNVLFHCINYYNYLRNNKFLKNDTVFDEDDLREFLDAGRKTIIAICNHKKEAIDFSSNLERTIYDSITNEESLIEYEKELKKCNKISAVYIKKSIPYIYAAILPYLDLSEEDQIKKHLHNLFPKISFGKIEDVDIYNNLGEIIDKYPKELEKECPRQYQILMSTSLLLPSSTQDELDVEQHEDGNDEDNPALIEGNGSQDWEAEQTTNEPSADEVSDTDNVGGANVCENQTNTTKSATNQSSKKGSWLRNPKRLEYEGELGLAIKDKIWPWLNNQVCQLKFDDIQGTSRNTQIKYTCAILIHQTAISLNYAKPLSDNAASSFERVMSFENITRQTLKQYDEMMEAYYTRLEQRSDDYTVDHEGTYYDPDAKTMVSHVRTDLNIDGFRARHPDLEKFLAKNFDKITDILDGIIPKLRALLSDYI